MMHAVEVVKGAATAEETVRAGVAFVQKLGKETIRVESDVPGFLLNRINLVSFPERPTFLQCVNRGSIYPQFLHRTDPYDRVGSEFHYTSDT